MGCSFNCKIINHLHHADGLALIAPPSNMMQKLITECKSYVDVYGLEFDQMKPVFKPVNFKLNTCLNICWTYSHGNVLSISWPYDFG